MIILIFSIYIFIYIYRKLHESQIIKIKSLIYSSIISMLLFIFLTYGLNLLKYNLLPYKNTLGLMSITSERVMFLSENSNVNMSLELNKIDSIIYTDEYGLYEIRSFKNDIFCINTIITYELHIKEPENLII